MKITKKEEETTYQVVNKTHTFEINGKELKVYTHYTQDVYGEDWGEDEFDEEDKKEFSEDELEEIGDFVGDICGLGENETLDTDKEYEKIKNKRG